MLISDESEIIYEGVISLAYVKESALLSHPLDKVLDGKTCWAWLSSDWKSAENTGCLGEIHIHRVSGFMLEGWYQWFHPRRHT